MRTHSAVGAGLAVGAGARLTGTPPTLRWLAPMTLAFLLAAAGNVDNDVHDLLADSINRPSRPLPAGHLSLPAARWLGRALAAGALLLAFSLGAVPTAGALAALLLTAWYTRRLKSYPLVGPLLVGLVTAFALGYGGLVGGDLGAVLAPTAALGLFFGGREVVKTMYDIAGDRAAGVRTAATAWRPDTALRFATLLFGAAAGVAVYWGQHRGIGELTIILGAFLLVGPLALLWRNPDDRLTCNRVLVLSKVAGLAILIGLLWFPW